MNEGFSIWLADWLTKFVGSKLRSLQNIEPCKNRLLFKPRNVYSLKFEFKKKHKTK